MTKILARNALVATACVTTLFAGSGLALADNPPDNAPPVFTTCHGQEQEAVFTHTRNATHAKAGAVFAPIPFTLIPGGPSGADADTYTVTFSGEADGTVGGLWAAQAQVSVNGGAFFNIDPVGPNTFLTGTDAQTHTMTWCRRLVANTTDFRIMWAKFGGGVALIDDFLMRVERSD
jgi:hypothetical protein